jgi:anti-sigma regulatory factor (Ser/Thr protein kinase)
MNALTVPATLESLPAIEDYVTQVVAAAGLPNRSAYSLRLAVVELATNSISYGYPAGQPGTVRMHATLHERTVTVVLEDDGIPFDPRRAKPPTDLGRPAEERKIGGLGVFLALRSVDQFDYEYAGNRNRSIMVVNRPQGS